MISQKFYSLSLGASFRDSIGLQVFLFWWVSWIYLVYELHLSTLYSLIGHVSNIPATHIFTGISKYSQNYIFYHWLGVSGISKIMHCGIVINMPNFDTQARFWRTKWYPKRINTSEQIKHKLWFALECDHTIQTKQWLMIVVVCNESYVNMKLSHS